jgi:hypothetical protein
LAVTVPSGSYRIKGEADMVQATQG